MDITTLAAWGEFIGGRCLSMGAYRPNMTIFMLKNLLSWKDRVEQVRTGALVLRFDAQDAAA